MRTETFDNAVLPVFLTRHAKPVCWLLSVPLFLISTLRPGAGVLVRVGVCVGVLVGQVGQGVRDGVKVAVLVGVLVGTDGVLVGADAPTEKKASSITKSTNEPLSVL